MKILFVCSGNRGEANITIKRQAESLTKIGCIIDFYLIKGGGVFGYLGNILPLRKKIRNGNYDVIHSHYSLSAFVSSLAGARKMIVSLMGSDVKSSKYGKFLIYIFSFLFSWHAIIVKSMDMKTDLGLKKVHVIPNGIDINFFKPLDKKECCKNLKWDSTLKNILFAGNPARKEKNFELTKKAFALFNNSDSVLHVLNDISPGELPLWYNAADAVILTSFWEGSPNVIKEAMACNRPVISTNVGDIAWLFGDTRGCYIIPENSKDQVQQIVLLIREAIKIENSNGRSRIINLGLDSTLIALKIIDIYSDLLSIKHIKT